MVQTIYQGGQVLSSLRSAKLIKSQALLDYQTIVADSLLSVRVAYYGRAGGGGTDRRERSFGDPVYRKTISITSNGALSAGTRPKFNVLQAEVELANEKPKLIQARNAYRISKNNLVNVLGHHVPRDIWEDIPLQLTDKLDSDPYKIELPLALAKALENRSELASLRKQEGLRKEGITSATSNYKPTFQVFGGYGARSAQFISDDPGYTIHGASAGAQFTWNIFDGLSTKGKTDQAKELYAASKVEVDNETRRIRSRSAHGLFQFHRGDRDAGVAEKSAGRSG